MPTSPPPVAPSDHDAAVSHNAAEAPSDHGPDHHRDGPSNPQEPAIEIGGRGGLEPTRFGDWEKNGRCIDF